ncbi:MAG: complex I subunit 5 family protein [Pseudomonadota bacterium]
MILAALVWPLVLALLVLLPRVRGYLHHLLALAGLPLVVLAAVSVDGPMTESHPGLLIGVTLGVDGLRWPLLCLVAALWTLAGAIAGPYLAESRDRARFAVFWLVCLAGNAGLILAQDVVTFYSAFALMSFSAYGLIVHEGNGQARAAARLYMGFAVCGEGLLLAGLLMAVHEAQDLSLAVIPEAVAVADNSDSIIGLLIAGFGIKAGLAGLHFWLPRAHPVAPTPASAVLSGAMIKAGVFGWLVFLPLGEGSWPGWGAVLVGLGALGAFGAALVGVCSRAPKVVLAWSSISQMGIATLAVGVAMAAPGAAPAVIAAVVAFMLHHGLAKGALFLSSAIGLPEQRVWRWLLLVAVVWPGLALVGIPGTSGAAAKDALKRALQPADGAWAGAADLLSLGVVATTLLVLNFLWCWRRGAVQGRAGHPVMVGGWLGIVLLSAVAVPLWQTFWA